MAVDHRSPIRRHCELLRLRSPRHEPVDRDPSGDEPPELVCRLAGGHLDAFYFWRQIWLHDVQHIVAQRALRLQRSITHGLDDVVPATKGVAGVGGRLQYINHQSTYAPLVYRLVNFDGDGRGCDRRTTSSGKTPLSTAATVTASRENRSFS